MSPPRPRDRLGRPLAPGDPAAYPSVPERTDVDTATALGEAERYLAEGLPFHAHEVLEQRWRCAPDDERTVWRALAQWAAALTHAARGNVVGALALLRRAADGLDGSAAGPALVDGRGRTLDVAALAAQCRADAVQVDQARPRLVWITDVLGIDVLGTDEPPA